MEEILALMPILIADRNRRISRATAAAGEMFGARPDDLLGRPLDDLLPLDVQAPPDHTEPFVFEVRRQGRRLDGSTVLLRARGGILAHGPEDERIAICLADLSGEQEAEARARALSGQIQQVWRLNSLGEMAGILAHELNQPLAAATTYLHAAEVDLDKVGLMGQSASRTVALAKRQVLRAGEIIRRMRDLLGSESRASAPERISFLLSDLEPVLQMAARDAGATLEIDACDAADEVVVDRVQVQQAVVNLVRNAIEAAATRPEPRVRLSGHRVGEAYRIQIEDSGPGFPPGASITGTEPLSTTKAGGMGLGLSITRNIVESHGGVIDIGESPLGGASVWFDLPRGGAQA